MKKCKECGSHYRNKRREAAGLCPTCVFWSLVDKTSSPHGCWLWTGSLTPDGYGKFLMTSPVVERVVRAHRISWVLENGHVGGGLHVLHNCDRFYKAGDITNRRCVNPDHMRLGTQLDNINDMVTHGRCATGDRSGSRLHPEKLARGDNNPSRLHPESVVRGVNHKFAKLNDDKVKEIRASCESNKILAKRMGVGVVAVARARIGTTWRHVV